MEYIITAWILNQPNFVKKYNSYEEAKVKYDSLLSRCDCSYVELIVECSSIIHKSDKRLDIYTVRYLDFGCECEQDFLSREEAEEFMEDYKYKYDNMEIY